MSGGTAFPAGGSTIATARLIIRHPRVEDAEAVNAGIRESYRELRPYMPWAQPEPPIEETRRNLAEAIAAIARREDLRFLVFTAAGEFVASSGLHKPDWRIGKAEIGYWIRTPMSGRGYMTEAVDAIARYGFDALGLRRIEIIVSGGNLRSRRIAERLGFAMEGVLRQHRMNADGSIDDTVYYAKCRPPS